MDYLPTNRPPTHPGEILLTEFLEPMHLSQRQLANAINVPYQRLNENEIVNGRRGVTPSTALRLAKFFGVSVGFWMNLQAAWDVYHTQQKERDDIEKIPSYHGSYSSTA